MFRKSFYSLPSVIELITHIPLLLYASLFIHQRLKSSLVLIRYLFYFLISFPFTPSLTLSFSLSLSLLVSLSLTLPIGLSLSLSLSLLVYHPLSLSLSLSLSLPLSHSSATILTTRHTSKTKSRLCLFLSCFSSIDGEMEPLSQLQKIHSPENSITTSVCRTHIQRNTHTYTQ